MTVLAAAEAKALVDVTAALTEARKAAETEVAAICAEIKLAAE